MDEAVLHRALGRVEGKVDSLEADVKDIKKLLQEHHVVTDTRMASLENSRSRLLGTVSTVGAVFGIIGSWLASNLLPRIPH